MLVRFQAKHVKHILHPRNYIPSKWVNPVKNSDIKGLIERYARRVQKLREQQATLGISTPPEVLIEIEDIEIKIRELHEQLKKLDISSNINELIHEVRLRCCRTIQHSYQRIQLLNRRLVEVNQLYVDVYLLEDIMSEVYVEIEALPLDFDPRRDRLWLENRKFGHPQPGLEIAAKYSRLMILGKPGAGKSTFLKSLAVECCNGEFLSDYIPVFILLRDINASDFNLFDTICQAFGGQVDTTQTEAILQHGKVLLLLDGLDEVPSEYHQNIQQQIRIFSQNPDYCQHRLILTCRTQTTEYVPPGFTCVEVADFDEKKVQQFAHNWFSIFPGGEKGEELASRFWETLNTTEHEPTKDLAVTPILLSLTCWLFSCQENLPSKRADLYREGIKLLLQEWDEKQGISRGFSNPIYQRLSETAKQNLLGYLALKKFEGTGNLILFSEDEIQRFITQYLQISDEDSILILRSIEAQHGLLIERAKGVWSFSHLTFQEYFAAKFIVDSDSPEIIFQHLISCVREPHRWREVLLLATNMLDKKNTDTLLESIKDQIDSLLMGDEKLQDILRWIAHKSVALDLPYKSAAIRAFYLYSNMLLSLAISPDIQYWINLPLIIDIDPSLRDKKGTDSLNLDGNLLIAYVRAYLGAFWTAYEDSNFVRYSPYLGADYLNIVLTENLNSEDDSSIKLKKSLQDLLNQVPVWDGDFDFYSQWWQNNNVSWSEQLKAIILEYRDVGCDWQLSDEQKQCLQQYYDSNKLLINCLNSGCGISLETRQRIEETLLLPVS